MAYISQTATRRPYAMGAVFLIHLGIGYVLVNGLGAAIGEIVAPTRPVTFDIPDEKTPPPPPPPQQRQNEAKESFVTTPDAQFDLAPLSPDIAMPELEFELPDFTYVAPPKIDAGPPVALPGFAPRGPIPRNDTSGWVTASDYPSYDLRRGNEGLVRFRVVVGTNGRVTSCEILATSGSARLDQTTCDKVNSRARFDPATDSAGKKVVEAYTGAVLWQIPD